MFICRNPGNPSYQMDASSCWTLGWATNWKRKKRKPNYVGRRSKKSKKVFFLVASLQSHFSNPNNLLSFYYPLSTIHGSYIWVCITNGAAGIFTAIHLFYLSRNKSQVSRVTPRWWDSESHMAGVPKRIRALNIFSELKKSLFVSRFEAACVWQVSALSIVQCPLGWTRGVSLLVTPRKWRQAICTKTKGSGDGHLLSLERDGQNGLNLIEIPLV